MTIDEELKKARASRDKWRSRRDTCTRKLKGIQRRIELLEFQLRVSETSESLPCRKISMPDGIDWGVFWKDVPLSTLPLSRTKGIGLSKSKLLIETFTNVGKLEAYRLARGFNSIPGFNRFAAANLEEMLLRWLRNYAPEYQVRASADAVPTAQEKRPNRDGILWLFE